MKTRILAGLVMLPLLAFLFLGGDVLLAGTFIIAIIGLREFYNAFKEKDIRASHIIGYGSTLFLYLIDLLVGDQRWYMLWAFATVVACLIYLFFDTESKLEDAMVTLTGVFYVSFFLLHLPLVDQTSEFSMMVWLVIISALGTDICAYFSGVFLGKHKLCPSISPKKTIEGSLGGILGSTVLCGVFGIIFVPDHIIHCFIIGVLCGAVSQFGDLTASIFKRRLGIKDYGNLIPGHGGVLDRFDSVLFTAPFIYYYLVFIGPLFN